MTTGFEKAVAGAVYNTIAATPGRVLLVDQSATVLYEASSAAPSRFVDLTALGVEPEEMWLLETGKINLAIVSKPRPPRDLFRVLALLHRVIAPGGTVLVLPYEPTVDLPVECRYEAIETFLGAYGSEWERRALGAAVVELRKGTSSTGAKAKEFHLVESAARFVVEPAPSGVGKRVISLAIFGDGGYWQYLPAYIRAHHALFPGYELRIHHDDAIDRAPYGHALRALEVRGLVALRQMPSRPETGKCEKMLWRIAPAWDPEVEYLFCRDIDALPTWRERRACEEFIASGIDAHALSDNPAHCGLMGGLCGFRAETLRALAFSHADFVVSAGFSDERWAQHGADQDFLNSRAGARLRVFEHAPFRYPAEEDRPERSRTTPTVEGATRFSVDLATFNDPRVPLDVRQAADTLIPYMGVAGHDPQRAINYYDWHCGAIDAIHEAERASESRSASPGTRRVVLSSDENEEYSFFAPLTCLLWVLRGYRPILLLVGEEAEWKADPRRWLAVERAREIGAQTVFIGSYPGYRTATIAQVARLFAAALPDVAPADYLITSDVDMWTLGAWVDEVRDEARPVHLYCANAWPYMEQEVRFPICYVGANASAWCSFMNINGGLREALAAVLAENASDCGVDVSIKVAWYFDERLVGRRLAAWSRFAERQEIPRDIQAFGQLRLDRSQWYAVESIAGFADAHLPRPGFIDENWHRIRPLLALSLSFDHLAWVDGYRDEWMKVQR